MAKLPKKILVPIDLSKGSNDALEAAFELAQKTGASVTVLHVINHIPMVDESIIQIPTDKIYDAMTEKAKKDLSKLLKGYGACETIIRVGVPTVEILSVIHKKKMDLVVLRSHSHKMLSRIFLGSVAEKVARQAGCSVWLVRS